MIKMPEPVAWQVYVANADNQYLVDDIDDAQLIDDCTNSDAEVTPLYTSEALRDALEQAAQIAEGYPKYGEAMAEEIRAMNKETP